MKDVRKSRFMRVIAAQLSLLLAFADVSRAAPALLELSHPSSPVTIENLYGNDAILRDIPEEYGSRVGAFAGRSQTGDGHPFVVHIQDAHANPQAQANIFRILEIIAANSRRENRPLFVAVEGTEGALHPEYFDIFPQTPEAGDAVVRDLHEKGELSGVELFAWQQYRGLIKTGTLAIAGAETTDIYKENLHSYRMLLFKRPEISSRLEEIKVSLEAEASKVLNPALLSFYKEREKRKLGRFSLDSSRQTGNIQAYLDDLRDKAGKVLSIDLSDPLEQLRFPNFVRVLHYQEAVKNFRRDYAEQAWREAREEIARKSPALSKDFEKAGIQAGYLPSAEKESKALSFEKIPARRILEEFLGAGQKDLLARYPDLLSSLRLMAFQEEADAAGLFREMDRLEQALFEKMTAAPEEKRLVAKLLAFEDLEKLLRLELTREEADLLAAKKETVENFSGSPELENAVQEALLFYRTAEKRDHALVDNALKMTAGQNPGLDSGTAAPSDAVLVIVSGGFHSDGIQEILREKRLDYAVVMPRIQDIDHGERYEKVMGDGNADLSLYFENKNPFPTKQEALFFRETLEVAVPVLSQKEKDARKVTESVMNAFRGHPVLSEIVQVEPSPEQEGPGLRFSPRAASETDSLRAAIAAALASGSVAFHHGLESGQVQRVKPYVWRFRASGTAKSELRAAQEATAASATPKPAAAEEKKSELRSAETAPSLDQRKRELAAAIRTPVEIKAVGRDEAMGHALSLLGVWERIGVFSTLIARQGTDHFNLEKVFKVETDLNGLKLTHVILATQYSGVYRELFLINDTPVGYASFQSQAEGPDIGFRIVEKMIEPFKRDSLARDIFTARLRGIYNFLGSKTQRFYVDPHQVRQHPRAPVFYRGMFFQPAPGEGQDEANALMAKYFRGERLADEELARLQALSNVKFQLDLDTPVDAALVQAYEAKSELRTANSATAEQAALKVSHYTANLQEQRKGRDGLNNVPYLSEPLREFFLSATELVGLMARDPEQAWSSRRFLAEPGHQMTVESLAAFALSKLRGETFADREALEKSMRTAGQEALFVAVDSVLESNLYSPVRKIEQIPLTLHADGQKLESYFAGKGLLPKPAQDEASITDLWFVYDPKSVLGLVASHREQGMAPHAKGGIRYISPVDTEGHYAGAKAYVSLFRDETQKNLAQKGVVVDLFDLVRAQETKNILGTEFHGAKAEYTFLPGETDANAFKKFSAALIDAGILAHEVPGPDIGMSGEKVQSGINEARRIVYRHLQRELEYLLLLVSGDTLSPETLASYQLTAEQLAHARGDFAGRFPNIKDPVIVYEDALKIIEANNGVRFLNDRVMRLVRMHMIRDYFGPSRIKPLDGHDPVAASTDELAHYFYSTMGYLAQNKDFAGHEFRRDYEPRASEALRAVIDKALGAVITGGQSEYGAIDHVVSAITAKGVDNAYRRTKDYLIKTGKLDKDKEVRLAFNGAGDVGGSAALMAARRGDKVVFMQDVNGAVYLKKGFSVAQLQAFNNIPVPQRNVVEFFGRIPGALPLGRDKLFSGEPAYPYDVLVTAAIANTLDKNNVENLIRAGIKAVVEGGNNTYKDVARRLAEAGIVTAWGSTANIGGVIASSHENRAKHRFTVSQLTRPTITLSNGKVLTAAPSGHYGIVPLERTKDGKITKGTIHIQDSRVVKASRAFPDLPEGTLLDLIASSEDGKTVWKAYVNNIPVGDVAEKGFSGRMHFQVDKEDVYLPLTISEGQVTTEGHKALPEIAPGPVKVRFPVRERKYETYRYVGEIIFAYQTLVLALQEPGNPNRDSIHVQRALSQALARKKAEIYTSEAYRRQREEGVRALIASGYIATPEEMLHIVSSDLARQELLTLLKGADGHIQAVETLNPFTDQRIRVSRNFDLTVLSEPGRAELRAETPKPWETGNLYQRIAAKQDRAYEILKRRFEQQEADDPYFEHFFNVFKWAFSSQHLGAATVTPGRLAREIYRTYELFNEYLQDNADPVKVSGFNVNIRDTSEEISQPSAEAEPNSQTELIIVTDNMPGIFNAATNVIALAGGDIRSTHFRVMKSPTTGREMYLSIFEIVNPDKLAFGDPELKKLQGDVRDAIREKLQERDKEMRVPASTKMRDTVFRGEIAVLREPEGGLMDVAYDVFSDLHGKGAIDAAQAARSFQEDIVKFQGAIMNLVMTLRNLPTSLSGGAPLVTPEKLPLMEKYISHLEAQTLQIALKPLTKDNQHRQSALSVFLNLLASQVAQARQMGETIEGLTIEEATYIGKIVVEELRGDFSVVNPDDPEGVQTEAVAQEVRYFKEALASATSLQGVTEADVIFRLSGLHDYINEHLAPAIINMIEGTAKDGGAYSGMRLRAFRAIPSVVVPAIERLRAGATDKERQNAQDLEEVFKKVIKLIRLQGSLGESLGVLDTQKELILFAHELDPYTLMHLIEKYHIKAIVTDGASTASHWVLVAENLNIPVFILDQKTKMVNIENEIWIGRKAILDGRGGEGGLPVLILNATEQTLADYAPRIEEQAALDRIKKRHAKEVAATPEGHEVQFLANADKEPEIAEATKAFGAEGVGLFRTEYLFKRENAALVRFLESFNRHKADPNDENARQLAEDRKLLMHYFKEIFRGLADTTAAGDITIRMFDMQRDKEDPAFAALNPERVYGARYYQSPIGQALLEIELEAAMRANAESERGPVKILFPQFYSPVDLLKTLNDLGHPRTDLKNITAEEQGKLNDIASRDVDFMIRIYDEVRTALLAREHYFENFQHDPEGRRKRVETMKRGVMIETVEALEILDKILGVVDYISVGTNDLTISLFRDLGISREKDSQYFDRLQHKVLEAIRKRILEVVSQRNAALEKEGPTRRIPVTICGALACVDTFVIASLYNPPANVPFQLSGSYGLIPSLKEIVRKAAAEDTKFMERLGDESVDLNAEAVASLARIRERQKDTDEYRTDLDKVRQGIPFEGDNGNGKHHGDAVEYDEAADRQRLLEEQARKAQAEGPPAATTAGTVKVSRQVMLGKLGFHFLSTNLLKAVWKAVGADLKVTITTPKGQFDLRTLAGHTEALLSVVTIEAEGTQKDVDAFWQALYQVREAGEMDEHSFSGEYALRDYKMGAALTAEALVPLTEALAKYPANPEFEIYLLAQVLSPNDQKMYWQPFELRNPASIAKLELAPGTGVKLAVIGSQSREAVAAVEALKAGEAALLEPQGALIAAPAEPVEKPKPAAPAVVKDSKQVMLGKLGFHFLSTNLLKAVWKAVGADLKVTITTPKGQFDLRTLAGHTEALLSVVTIEAEGAQKDVDAFWQALYQVREAGEMDEHSFSGEYGLRDYETGAALTAETLAPLAEALAKYPANPEFEIYLLAEVLSPNDQKMYWQPFELRNPASVAKLGLAPGTGVKLAAIGPQAREAIAAVEALKAGEASLLVPKGALIAAPAETAPKQEAAAVKDSKQVMLGKLGVHFLTTNLLKSVWKAVGADLKVTITTPKGQFDLRTIAGHTEALLSVVTIEAEGTQKDVDAFWQALFQVREAGEMDEHSFSGEYALRDYKTGAALTAEALAPLTEALAKYPGNPEFEIYLLAEVLSPNDQKMYWQPFELRNPASIAKLELAPGTGVKLAALGSQAREAVAAVEALKAGEAALLEPQGALISLLPEPVVEKPKPAAPAVVKVSKQLMLGKLGIHFLTTNLLKPVWKAVSADLKVTITTPKGQFDLRTIAGHTEALLSVVTIEAEGTQKDVDAFWQALVQIREAGEMDEHSFSAEYALRDYKTGAALTAEALAPLTEALAKYPGNPEFEIYLLAEVLSPNDQKMYWQPFELRNPASIAKLELAPGTGVKLAALGSQAREAVAAVEALKAGEAPLLEPQGSLITHAELRIAPGSPLLVSTMATHEFSEQLRGQHLPGFNLESAAVPSEVLERLAEVAGFLGSLFDADDLSGRLPEEVLIRGDHGVSFTARADAAALQWIFEQLALITGLLQNSRVTGAALQNMLREAGIPAVDAASPELGAAVHLQLEREPHDLMAFVPILAVVANLGSSLHINIAGFDDMQASKFRESLAALALQKGVELKTRQLEVLGTRGTGVFSTLPQTKLKEGEEHGLIGDDKDFERFPRRRGVYLFDLDPAAPEHAEILAATVITVIQALALKKPLEDYTHVLDPKVFAPDSFAVIVQAISTYLEAQATLQAAA